MHAEQKHNPISARGAFTVVELLVVIVIAVLLLTIAVPAFQNTIYSSNRSLAVNALQASSLMGRDVAINSGRDGAVVFVYDPEVQRMSIIPAVKVGTIREPTTAPSVGGGGGPPASGFGDQPYFDRDVFIPASFGEPLTMPENWMVRGYAPAGLLLDYDSGGNPAPVWYNSEMYGGEQNVNANPKEDGQWVFPETGFFPRDAQVNGGGLDGDLSPVDRDGKTARQSFMIRFDGRTGAVSRDTRSALFVDPRNSTKRPWGEVRRLQPYQRSLRIDIAEDLEVWATRVLNSPDLDGDGFGYDPGDRTLREQLIGTPSNDTILVKPVTRLALYDEAKLALALGTRGLNKDTNSLYLPHDQDERDVDIQFDERLFSGSFDQEDTAKMINQWIDGDTNFDEMISFLTDEPDSRLFLVQSYTGELKEVLR